MDEELICREGTIHSVIFQNADNGYTVLRLLTEEGEVMAVRHDLYPIFGVQFHPESILTPDGKTMLENFIHL